MDCSGFVAMSAVAVFAYCGATAWSDDSSDRTTRVLADDPTGTVVTHGYNPVEAQRGAGVVRSALPSVSVLFVDDSAAPGGDGASWATAYRDLQQALADASADPTVTEIRVAEGLYFPDAGTGDRAAEFLLTGQSDLALLGGFPDGGGPLEERDPVMHLTVLSGDLNQDDVVTFEPFDREANGGQGNFETAGPAFANTGDNSFTVLGASGASETVVLDGVVIEGGNDFERGGGMIAANAALTIRNVTFRKNRAGSQGAGLFIASSTGLIVVEGCRFERNGVVGDGGGMYVQFAELLISDTEFLENFAEDNGEFGLSGGAGLHVGTGDGPVRIESSLFSANTSQKDGGGLFAVRAVDLLDCVFIENTASLGGGARFEDNDPTNQERVRINGSRFESNSSQGPGAGVVFGSRSSPSVSGAEFLNNAVIRLLFADGGGGVAVFGSGAIFTDTVFTGNAAAGQGGGAAAGEFNRFVRCEFRDNESGFGGGGLVVDRFCRIIGCTFDGNSAPSSSGGAILFDGDSNLLANSVVSYNSAGQSGGAVAAFGQGQEITQTVLVGNSANQIGGVNGSSPVTLSNSILWNNTDAASSVERAQLGGAFHDVSNTLIQGLSDYAGGGNVGDDPLVVDLLGPDAVPGTGDEDFRLRGDSPAIDAGDATALPEDREDLDGDGDIVDPLPVDIDGNARVVAFLTVDPRVDLGPYEAVDCNRNTIPDRIDIAQGTSLDTNGDGVPDECGGRCVSDLDDDGDVDLGDFGAFGVAFGSIEGDPTYDPAADFDGDGDVDLGDFGAFGVEFGRSDCSV